MDKRTPEHKDGPGALAREGTRRDLVTLPRALPTLLAGINDARGDLADARRRQASVPPRAEQRHLYDALATYAQALTALGIPVPPRVRGDLLMYGALLASDRR